MKLKNSYHPYAIITIIFWSLAYIMTRLALQYYSAFALGFLRYFVASCAFLAICFLAKIRLPKKKDIKYFILAGFLGFFLYMLFFNMGSKTVTSATSSILIATSPVITALFARILYKERLSKRQWAAIAVEFAGILVLTLWNGVFSLDLGVVWIILASFVLSGYNLLQRRLTKTYPALQTSAFSVFAGTLMLAVFLPASANEIQHAPALQIIYLLILGICCSAVAYASWSKAFALAEKTSYVSNYMFITPFLATLLGYILGNEVPALSTYIGGAVILSGVFLFNAGGGLRTGVKKSLQD